MVSFGWRSDLTLNFGLFPGATHCFLYLTFIMGTISHFPKHCLRPHSARWRAKCWEAIWWRFCFLFSLSSWGTWTPNFSINPIERRWLKIVLRSQLVFSINLQFVLWPLSFKSILRRSSSNLKDLQLHQSKIIIFELCKPFSYCRRAYDTPSPHTLQTSRATSVDFWPRCKGKKGRCQKYSFYLLDILFLNLKTNNNLNYSKRLLTQFCKAERTPMNTKQQKNQCKTKKI